jgi:hypothetical protein
MTESAFGLSLTRFDQLKDVIHDQNYRSCKISWLGMTGRANFKVIMQL